MCLKIAEAIHKYPENDKNSLIDRPSFLIERKGDTIFFLQIFSLFRYAKSIHIPTVFIQTLTQDIVKFYYKSKTYGKNINSRDRAIHQQEKTTRNKRYYKTWFTSVEKMNDLMTPLYHYVSVHFY